LDILDMRRKLDEEERRLSEAKLMPIQLQVQELEARRLQEQGQVRQMELQYQLRQSELQQEEVRLHQAQLQQQLEEQQRQRLQQQQDLAQWGVQQQQLQLEQQQAAWQQDSQHLAQQQLLFLQQQQSQVQQLQSSEQSLQQDDAALLSILGQGGGGRTGAEGSGTALRRPQSAGGTMHVRRSGSCGANNNNHNNNPRHLRVEVRRKADIVKISRALSAADLVLQRDLELDGRVLPKGLRLLRQGRLRGSGPAKVALEALEPWLHLTFERPLEASASFAPAGRSGLLPTALEAGREGFVSYAWTCPGCRSPYPIQ
ncbi:unnamed protein product, partial [Polarella glacialis]